MYIVNEVTVVDDRLVALFIDRDDEHESDTFHERHSMWWPFLCSPLLLDPCVSNDALVLKAWIVVEGDVVVFHKMVNIVTDHEIDMKSFAVASGSAFDRDLRPRK